MKSMTINNLPNGLGVDEYLAQRRQEKYVSTVAKYTAIGLLGMAALAGLTWLVNDTHNQDRILHEKAIAEKDVEQQFRLLREACR